MATAKDVAAYLLMMQDEDAGERITNLKLQKLCYYAQGFHLALFGRPLFEERIEAWEHGPVVPTLYHSYKIHGWAGIPIPEHLDTGALSPEERGLLDEVAEVYGQYSAWKLRDMTHAEPPWKDTERGQAISHQAMQAYFSQHLVPPPTAIG